MVTNIFLTIYFFYLKNNCVELYFKLLFFKPPIMLRKATKAQNSNLQTSVFTF